MLALVVVLLVVVVLLGVVVTGLLRSHADIIRALHTLGVGVGDPAGTAEAPATPPGQVPVNIGPPLPSERASSSAPDIEGVSPDGDALAVSMGASPQTLLAFLSSGCATCALFWTAIGQPQQLRLLPAGVRVVVVTKGPEWESPNAVAAKAPPDVTVVMSSDAWTDYEVPGSPYFALVDGARGIRVGEGVANQWSQIADLVERARGDERPPAGRANGAHAHAGASVGRARSLGLNGAERETRNDEELMAAGIFPGDPSLYPQRLDDVFAATEHLARPPAEVRPSAEAGDGREHR